MENNNLEEMRHTAAHVLMQALIKLYPDAVPGVGPAIENGFYHDFDCSTQISEDDLPRIEQEMKKIIKKNFKVEKLTLSFEEAYKFFDENKFVYTKELAQDLEKEGEKDLTFYKQAGFMNMCKGPHVETTGKIGPFKLTKVAGAYWKGDENNKMIQRIYGVAFQTQEELDDYLKMQEEAEKRDHRKIGKEQDLFVFSDLVGSGLPMFTPKGTIIIDELKKYVEEICSKYGFQKVMTPHLAKIDLYKISGHADKFSEELFHVSSRHKHEYVLKPVQCPHQTQIYASRPRSYKELPIRYMESEKQYRAEKPGEVGGLRRVYAITVEDGHSFCRVDQVKQEVKNMITIIKDFYTTLGLLNDYWVSLSVRDYDHPEKYIGEPKDWDTCEEMLKEISEEMGLNAKRCEGEAALYGPKIDFMFKDALGKEIQIPTVQLDFATPKRFELTYVNEEGNEVNPVMVHRAILGSYERFLVLLIEHLAGAFPTWLSPVQVKILPVSDKFLEYANEVKENLLNLKVRVELDDRTESLGKKIRDGETEKVPYILVIGEKEVADKKVAVRKRHEGDLGAIPTEDFITQIKKEIEEKK